MIVVGSVLIVLGSALLVIAALGLFVLPDALARQHAATKAGTLALGSVLVGVAVVGGDADWWWRAAAIVLLLAVTLPVASHMLGRAAVGELVEPEALDATTREPT